MSRIGRKPIPVPAGVNVAIEPERVTVNGPKGELSERIHRDITVAQEGEELVVTRPTDRGEHRALHGLTRSLVANMVEGVTSGFEKRLEIQGVGYRAQLKGKDLELALGYSHPVPIKAPDGIEFEVPQPTRIVVRGHLQAARRRDRRQHPQAAQAGALQGQGHSLRGRVRRPEGREARMTVLTAPARRLKRRRRVRAKIHGTAERPRISVFRSQPRHQRAARSTTTPVARSPRSTGPRRSCAASRAPTRPKRVGELLAERAKAAGVTEAVFDRGGYQYHGRVQALAEGAREGGLAF